jgi:hypothetical protein
LPSLEAFHTIERLSKAKSSVKREMAMQFSVTYEFTQLLEAPAKAAYHWCTDYQPDDLSLMKEKGQRKISWITDDTVILHEYVQQGGRISKKIKLVKLDPARFSWYNIQLSGPNKHSAFLYTIDPEGNNRSRLTFRGLLVIYSRVRLTEHKLRQIARDEKRYDATAWKHLAKALHEQMMAKS